jgi:PPP family 3-phenylpropionic acid transporter
MAACAVFLLPLSLTAVACAMVVFCAFFNAVLPQFESLTLSHLVGRSERYGAIRVWGSFGFIAVVASLGALFEHLPAAALPWLMLPLFALLAATSFLNDYGPAPAVETTDGGFLALVMRREVQVFLVIVFLMQISFGPYNTFFSLYLKQNDYRPAMLGTFWAIGVVVEIAVFAFAAPLLRRIPARRMIVLALVLASLRWTLTAMAPRNLGVMVLVQLSHAVVFGGFYAAYMQLLAEYFPGRAAGHGQALFTGLSSGVGGVLGALIAGFAWHAQGGQLAFLIGGASAGIGALVAAREFGRTSEL